LLALPCDAERDAAPLRVLALLLARASLLPLLLLMLLPRGPTTPTAPEVLSEAEPEVDVPVPVAVVF
jgi:hypothetical protein